MKLNNKKISLSLAIVAALSSGAAFADKGDVDFDFYGYGRMGIGYSNQGDLYGTDDNNDSKVNGQNIIKTAGSQFQSTGRLGNEGMGFEFGLKSSYDRGNGHKAEVVVYADDYYAGGNSYDNTDGQLNWAQVYVGADGLIQGQEDAYVWAGKRWNREYVGLNDYYWMNNSGTGFGIDDLTVANMKLNLGLTAGDNGNNGLYAVTAKLHDLKVGNSGTLAVNAGYGFDTNDEHTTDAKLYDANGNPLVESSTDSLGNTTNVQQTKTEKYDNDNAWQLALTYKQDYAMGWTQVTYRLGDNARTTLTDSSNDGMGMTNAVLLSGDVVLSSKIHVEYSANYEYINMVQDNNFAGDQAWTQAIVRPTYTWNKYTNTQLDMAYDQVDFKDVGETNSSWKTTVAQNINLGTYDSFSPVLRLFTTYGKLDTNYDGQGNSFGTKGADDYALTFGAMFEASW
ncbi:carbohydrate porin [Vibrio sp. SS-MA-C1-2]|uniref:carbohydrate porin n=1 Tax=Vibrio sp. SS-MA-C1-2 TaxID=2908646 RepID=UPI001F41585C|nr:carbohydrate porin [Vibrio sp. SS-MA-C1-2]UJF18647.1 carbohydrate porin [Vibrio sp. SS-MA-C1-2]